MVYFWGVTTNQNSKKTMKDGQNSTTLGYREYFRSARLRTVDGVEALYVKEGRSYRKVREAIEVRQTVLHKSEKSFAEDHSFVMVFFED